MSCRSLLRLIIYKRASSHPSVLCTRRAHIVFVPAEQEASFIHTADSIDRQLEIIYTYRYLHRSLRIKRSPLTLSRTLVKNHQRYEELDLFDSLSNNCLLFIVCLLGCFSATSATAPTPTSKGRSLSKML